MNAGAAPAATLNAGAAPAATLNAGAAPAATFNLSAGVSKRDYWTLYNQISVLVSSPVGVH